ncbi:transcriptional regulatory protein [Mycolicibacterium mageritense DSM 44476 = CIP 104973]|uniref:TetR family transcriptional regulator n=1 Tax=Mycolicibacterium mageritense TaxID=53462 RepID=A0AAI8TS38_MYCME|nr:TetR/AcrR family transcriptional regulator [Mycolicibacterium mageritense]MBN3455538.1 TetR/AcrR family transcriptional regulator [Mycobacterium sp. DSM 3803]OKH78850.1 TetR family transcriptional regulator [Mycobacterium sp. SWH-M3]MCC9184222.1 TetR/AcrR family transcriptional regulator [Mycolicibacterium mageritense]TXI62552.1 MAG: TetR/AcrR family transcriptional regulator [Mycolicibacterium mageritense]CDO21904.1 transcriptional regulatory protein [Mycolicibacterium mageritense DSM 4447
MTAAATSPDAFRLRLLDGLAASITEKGYRETTVADIVRHARTSKRTFYDQFESKEDCFIELLRANNTSLVDRIRTAVAPDTDWQDQIAQAVGAYVDHIESAPAVTLSWIRELPALGTKARPLQRAALRELTDLLIELSDSAGFRHAELPQLTRPMAIILLGGLRELTALIVEDGRDIREIYEPALAASRAILSAAPAPSTQDQPR